jgi:23S rRNA (cytosine1962-C5)-methyltransferase
LGLLDDLELGDLFVFAARRPHHFLWQYRKRSNRELRLLIEGGQSADHPVHPAMPETRYLKALVLEARTG